MKKSLFLFIYIIPFFSYSQCLLKEIELDEKAGNSALILEGKITSQYSFWNSDKTFIYTANTLEVFKIFKGTLTNHFIEIISEGGIVGDVMITAEPGLKLREGDCGVFFIEQIPQNGRFQSGNVNSFRTFAGEQGVIRYDIEEGIGFDPFKKYINIPVEIYGQLAALTGKFYTEIKPFSITKEKGGGGPKANLTINNFSPSNITAGTKAVLTITGVGFGTAQGTSNYVEFRDANSGGSQFYKPLSTEYISWTDTEIKVNVPYRAGNGTFRIVNGTSSVTSSSPLSISYSHLNATSSGETFQTAMVNKSNGGYIWRMNDSFDANSAAKESFLRAFQSWRCGTYVNWSVGASTTTNIVSGDGINIIRFDSGSELPSGVLGVCYTYWSGCGSGSTMNWYVNELDIVFDDGANWYFETGSPASNQYDFETVALHELGHGHQLGHVIFNNGIMHYAVGAGQTKRILSSDDLNGGNYVMLRSTSNSTCGLGSMQSLNSSNCSISGGAVANVNISITSGTNPSCDGNTLTFTANAINGGTSPSYQWKVNGNNIGTNSKTFSTSNLENGQVVSCVMTSSMGGVGGSPATSNSIIMTIDPKPATPNVIAIGTDSLSSSVSAMSYQWWLNGTTNAGTTKTIKPTIIGNYSVRVTNNGCNSNVSPDYFYSPIGTIGIEEAETSTTLRIYPNPSSGEIFVAIEGISSESADFIITDIIGKTISSSNINLSGNSIQKIIISGSPAGIYFVKITADEKSFVSKIVIQ